MNKNPSLKIIETINLIEKKITEKKSFEKKIWMEKNYCKKKILIKN